MSLGTDSCPLRVAVVGAGPSGFYIADALFRAKIPVQVDAFDRLPTPFGLLRGGVAPDHQQMKTVGKYYEKVAATPGFRFIGNVKVGKDITVEELAQYYDAIVFTCGAETDKKLGIPGESLNGSHTATEFVGWYNGHPDYHHLSFDLDQEVVAIIGQGNVAIDVTRILAKTKQELADSDITENALEKLCKSKIKEIHLIGRRGPVQSAFTELEIKELGELEACDVYIDPVVLDLNPSSQQELDEPSNNKARKNMAVITELANRPHSGKPKKIVVRYFEGPVEILGQDHVTGIVLEKNRLEGDAGQQKALGTGEKVTLNCGLVFRSVGYRGVAIPGVPFDEKRGVFPNENGRIQKDGMVWKGYYCAGWIKRGPSGVLGTNKPDSAATVAALLEDLPGLSQAPKRDTDALLLLLEAKGVQTVSFEDWKKIDEAELKKGVELGKPREKMTSVQEMLGLVEKKRS